VDGKVSSHAEVRVLSTDPLNDLAVLKLNHPSAYPLFKALKFGKELAPGRFLWQILSGNVVRRQSKELVEMVNGAERCVDRAWQKLARSF
jgi:hypothetical protein